MLLVRCLSCQVQAFVFSSKLPCSVLELYCPLLVCTAFSIVFSRIYRHRWFIDATTCPLSQLTCDRRYLLLLLDVSCSRILAAWRDQTTKLVRIGCSQSWKRHTQAQAVAPRVQLNRWVVMNFNCNVLWV
jgi:hypothetical protein